MLILYCYIYFLMTVTCIFSHGNLTVSVYFVFQKYNLLAALVCAVVCLHISESKVAFDYACDPRSSETSCLLGCLGCFEYYGGHMYNMAACCQECKDTQSYLIDDGPVKCSQRFIKGSWYRRFGKWWQFMWLTDIEINLFICTL